MKHPACYVGFVASSERCKVCKRQNLGDRGHTAKVAGKRTVHCGRCCPLCRHHHGEMSPEEVAEQAAVFDPTSEVE